MHALRTILVLLAILALASAERDDNDGNRGGGNKNRKRDVCIVGGGASGLASAVFLKDRGYDVLVLEVASNVGGHCNTYRYNDFPVAFLAAPYRPSSLKCIVRGVDALTVGTPLSMVQSNPGALLLLL